MRFLLWSEWMERKPSLAGRVDRVVHPVKGGSRRYPGPLPWGGRRPRKPLLEDHVERWDGDEGEERRHEEPADHRDGEGLVRFGPDPEGERHRQETHDRGERGHEDGPEPDASGARDGDEEGLAVAAALVDVLDEEHTVREV